MNAAVVAIGILFLYFNIDAVTCRKYDIEEDAKKLYGQDLTAVLENFRKSPEYLSILNDKVKEIRHNFDEMAIEIWYNYQYGVLPARVKEMFPTNNDNKPEALDETVLCKRHTRWRSILSVRTHRRRAGLLRQQEPAEEASTVDTTTKSPVELLDSLWIFEMELSVAENNAVKDMAFELAKEAMDTIISNMNPSEQPKSTRLPQGGEDTRYTPRPTRHTTTTESHIQDGAVDGTSTPAPRKDAPDLYRHGGKKGRFHHSV